MKHAHGGRLTPPPQENDANVTPNLEYIKYMGQI